MCVSNIYFAATLSWFIILHQDIWKRRLEEVQSLFICYF